MNPELSDDSATLDNCALLTNSPTSGESENVGDSSSKPNSKRGKFVPHDDAMAKVFELLRVDLNAVGDRKVKRKKGHAKVDSNWINNVASVDWKCAFSDEGHLRLTRIFDMLPKLVRPPDAHYSLWLSYRRLKSAALGLEDYNRCGILPCESYHFSRRRHKYVSHANFLAKRKNSPGSPVELFFAEVVYHSDEVVLCSPVKPEMYPLDVIPPLETATFKRGRVIHLQDFVCSTCNLGKLRYLM